MKQTRTRARRRTARPEAGRLSPREYSECRCELSLTRPGPAAVPFRPMLNSRTFVNWPFLHEALVVGVSDASKRIWADRGDQARIVPR